MEHRILRDYNEWYRSFIPSYQPPFRAFYHAEGGPNGSGPSQSSQRLALWYGDLHIDWPYIALFGIDDETLMDTYDCSCADALVALTFIDEFCCDVEKRYVMPIIYNYNI